MKHFYFFKKIILNLRNFYLLFEVYMLVLFGASSWGCYV